MQKDQISEGDEQSLRIRKSFYRTESQIIIR